MNEIGEFESLREGEFSEPSHSERAQLAEQAQWRRDEAARIQKHRDEAKQASDAFFSCDENAPKEVREDLLKKKDLALALLAYMEYLQRRTAGR